MKSHQARFGGKISGISSSKAIFPLKRKGQLLF
jgi:hypothetical protein